MTQEITKDVIWCNCSHVQSEYHIYIYNYIYIYIHSYITYPTNYTHFRMCTFIFAFIYRMDMSVQMCIYEFGGETAESVRRCQKELHKVPPSNS